MYVQARLVVPEPLVFFLIHTVSFWSINLNTTQYLEFYIEYSPLILGNSERKLTVLGRATKSDVSTNNWYYYYNMVMLH